MSEEYSKEWAQLVCVTDTVSPPFLIAKDKFTIGRNQSCDISHENNKLVSGSHCYILRDESGKVWLYDTSTNGTLLNSKTKLSKGECREIEHGDEFFVVHKKGEENVNIGYVFQDMARLKEEEKNDSGELGQTQEYEDGPPPADVTILDDNINQVDSEEDEEETRSAVKRKQTSRSASEDGPASPSTKCMKASDPEVDRPFSSATTDKPTGNTTKFKDSNAEPKSAAGCAEAKAGKVDDGKEEDKKGKKEEREEKESGLQTVTKSDVGKTGEDDVFSETLTCIICQELLYDCVSLQPCMHSFCAGCYSEWMAHCSECPSCRGKVDRINKNHIVNNLVEAYLKEHPEKRRPEADTKELDAKNKITRDMLYPSRRQRQSSSEYEDSDDNGDSNNDNVVPPPAAVGTIFGLGTPFWGTASNAYKAVCRQCPGQNDHAAGSTPGIIGSAIRGIFGGPQPTAATTTATTTLSSTNTATASTATPTASGSGNNNNEEQPSTSGAGPSGEADHHERDKKTMPVAPAYMCAANQNHVLCQCCFQIFPDRRQAYSTAPDTLPPQQCTICFRAFCHAYWGCRKADCNGCLAKFGDMNFGRKVLPGLILNHYESEIFTNYLDTKKLAVKDVLQASIAKLEQGEYNCPDQSRYNITGKTPLCFACGLRNFKSLAYQYRADIPQDQLPAEVTARPNCYWGKNCRTQHNKPAHATRFNHICEQTRT